MEIYTLGNFDIKLDGKSIMGTEGHPYKTIRLFKYFLTFKGKRLLPENIIEDLWYESHSTDPKNILRTQISRVRNMLKTEDDKVEKLFDILYKNGYYIFNITHDYIMDVELFEKNMVRGNQLKESSPMEALKVLKKGLELYNGQYLQEMEYEEWVIPIRNRYHRLYLQGLMNLIDILEENNMYEEIVKLCEEAIHHEPYGEDLNIKFIEALLALGQKPYAISHYEYFTSKLYIHLQMPPSDKMKSIYKKLQMSDEDTEHVLTLNNIEDELKNTYEKEKPMICDLDYFKFIYYLESRKKDRDGKKDDYLFIVTIYNKGSEKTSEEDIKQGMLTLIDVMYNDFRKGDVISKWNESQIICLLYNVREGGLEIIADRLNRKYEENIENKNIILNIMFKDI